MPELPEVETIRRDLARVLQGKRVARVAVRAAKLVRGSSADVLARRLRKRTVRGVRRRGKLLIFSWDDPNLFLLIHLKMTGQLIFTDERRIIGGGHGYPVARRGELPNRYTHIIFTFTDGTVLYFNDMRKFGFVRIADARGLERLTAAFGVEPLSAAFTAAELRRRLAGRRARLKSVLLDQRAVAGLGNIYADEACYEARVRPTRRADRLSRAEIHALRAGIQRILRRALRWRGTTFGSYRDGLGGEGKFVARLRVYGRSGQPCRRCGQILKRVVVGGRGTVYCAICQPR